MSPTTLAKAAALAKLFEEWYEPNSKPKFSNSQARTSNTNQPYPKYSYNPIKADVPNTNPKANQSPLLRTPNSKPLNQTQNKPKIKYISQAEMQVRRDKGLSYWCDDKFSFSLKCPNKQLMMLQLTDDSDLNEEIKPPDIDIATAEMPRGAHHLSLNAMKGFHGVGTIRFTGNIGNIRVQIMVDGDNSESFLQPRIAMFLKLPIEPEPHFRVLVGNGQIMETEGWVKQLAVDIQGQKLLVPVYLLPVSGADLILGSPWLATLGPHVADYAALTLKFFYHGNFLTLQGEVSSTPTQAHLHQLKRLHDTSAISNSFAIHMMQHDNPDDILT